MSKMQQTFNKAEKYKRIKCNHTLTKQSVVFKPLCINISKNGSKYESIRKIKKVIMFFVCCLFKCIKIEYN
jgi:hypothetical protein